MTQVDKSIFLVEDDNDLRDLLQDLLESEGYSVASASDGRDALSKLGQSATMPRLIILDWMMPVMDGPAFCREKAADGKLGNIPVLLLTANGSIDEKVGQTGAAMGLAKPVDLDVFLSAVHSLI